MLGLSLLDICGESAVGAWYVLDGSETGWSNKPQRPWLLVAVPEGGPTVQMAPRTTQDRGERNQVESRAHAHGPSDSDATSCRLNKDGWICVSDRKPIRRRLLESRTAYSCMEPADEILKAVGCRR